MLRKVHKNQVWTPPSASDYHAMAMAGERYLAGPDRTPEREQPINPCVSYIKNSSGAARRQFECLELEITPQLDDVTRENIWIDGIERADGTIPFAVLLEPVPDDKWTRGQVSGICPALVDIQDITHRWAYLPDGEYVLESTEEANASVSCSSITSCSGSNENTFFSAANPVNTVGIASNVPIIRFAIATRKSNGFPMIQAINPVNEAMITNAIGKCTNIGCAGGINDPSWVMSYTIKHGIPD